MRRVDAKPQQQRVKADLGNPRRSEAVALSTVSHPDDIKPIRESAKQF
jgi:hypothetical protein